MDETRDTLPPHDDDELIDERYDAPPYEDAPYEDAPYDAASYDETDEALDELERDDPAHDDAYAVEQDDAPDDAPTGDAWDAETPEEAAYPYAYAAALEDADEADGIDRAPATADDAPSSLDETERLRQPRAQTFRRRVRNQISMLPLALYLIAAGTLLSARALEIDALPDVTDAALAGAFVLVLGLTAVVHALAFGRRERGLLFVGLLVWVTAGLVAALLYFVDDAPDAAEWWPLLLAALGLTFFLTYLIERMHDARLVLLAILTLVAAGTAYAVTSEAIAQSFLDDAADYWPLLLAVLGVGLLPLAFRRRMP